VSAGAPLVTLIVGDVGRAGSARGRGSQQGPASLSSARQWSCAWTGQGPGPIAEGCDGEPDLTLGLSWPDAHLVADGELPPSVAYMQGRLKTSGDNELLLRALAWSATPTFAAALAEWKAGQAPA